MGDIGQLEFGPDILQGEDVGDSIFMKPHLTIILQSTLLVGSQGSSISIDSHVLITGVDILEQLLVAKDVHSGLIVQQDQVLQLELGVGDRIGDAEAKLRVIRITQIL